MLNVLNPLQSFEMLIYLPNKGILAEINHLFKYGF